MHQPRLKSGCVPSLAWATRSGRQNHASGPAPKSQQRDPCVPCRLLSSAHFPRCLRSPCWFSVRANQSYMNSHRRSAANSWLSGKSSCPNFCIFSLLSSRAGALPFEGFSILLEEIARSSFSGLIAIRLSLFPWFQQYQGVPCHLSPLSASRRAQRTRVDTSGHYFTEV